MSKGIRISEETRREMKASWTDGMPYRTIAERLGVSIAAVSRYCGPRTSDERYKPPHQYNDYYKNRWARKKGYESFVDYQNKRIEERIKQPKNMRMAGLVRDGLERIRAATNPPKFRKGYRWLAQRIGTCHKAVCLFAEGATLPRPEIARRIFEVLDLPEEEFEILYGKSPDAAVPAVEPAKPAPDNFYMQLTRAIRRTVYSDEKNEAEAIEKAKGDAERVLNFFGHSDRIIDNILEPVERDLFYTLHDNSLLGTEKEETTLYDGRGWNILYWLLKKEKVLELAEREKNIEAKKDKAGEVYEKVPDDVWIDHARRQEEPQEEVPSQ